MTSQHPLAGVYAAAVTPLRAGSSRGNADDSLLDLESVPALARFLASRGCHGIVLFGTTGEGPSFSPREREALMRAACAVREEVVRHGGRVGSGRSRVGKCLVPASFAGELTGWSGNRGDRTALDVRVRRGLSQCQGSGRGGGRGRRASHRRAD